MIGTTSAKYQYSNNLSLPVCDPNFSWNPEVFTLENSCFDQKPSVLANWKQWNHFFFASCS